MSISEIGSNLARLKILSVRQWRNNYADNIKIKKVMMEKDSNAYRIGHKDGYDEIISKMHDILGKCYNTGYKDAMDFICEWLTESRRVPLHYEEYRKYHEEFINNLRKAMAEHLRKEMEE